LTHTEPVALGTHGHWFQDTPAGFPVGKGETLFTYVYLLPDQKPEAVMVQWHDGTGWEHRAYWGADVLKIGKANTPGCRAMGPLPAAGEWVRLEVPADLVDLGGKNLHGMSFTLAGGQAYWHSAGAEELELGPAKTFAMKQTGANEWSGRFPLTGTGLFRPELRNSLGHANATKKEAKYVALPDNAPQIVLERPTADIVRSDPGVVPLVLAAFVNNVPLDAPKPNRPILEATAAAGRLLGKLCEALYLDSGDTTPSAQRAVAPTRTGSGSAR